MNATDTAETLVLAPANLDGVEVSTYRDPATGLLHIFRDSSPDGLVVRTSGDGRFVLVRERHTEHADGTFTMVEDPEPCAYGEIPQQNNCVVLRYRTRRVAVRRDSFYSVLKWAAYRYLRAR